MYSSVQALALSLSLSTQSVTCTALTGQFRYQTEILKNTQDSSPVSFVPDTDYYLLHTIPRSIIIHHYRT
jgi:hypothetical protein